MLIKSLRPVDDYLLLRVIGHEGKATSLFVAEVNESFRPIAVVVAAGRGQIHDGRIFPPLAQPGQQVLIPPMAGIKVDIDGVEHVLLKDQYVLGIVDVQKTKYEQMEEDLQSDPTSEQEAEQQRAMREILGKDIKIIQEKPTVDGKPIADNQKVVGLKKAPPEKVPEKKEKENVITDTTKDVKQTPVKIKTGKPKPTVANAAVKNAMKQKDTIKRNTGKAAQQDHE